MNRRIEAINEKLFITTLDGAKVTVLPLNGSAGFLPEPREDLLSDLFNILDLPDHPESSGQPLKIDPRYITEILGIENPTPEQEATLTAVLSGGIATGVGSVNARRITFSLGRTPMVAALADASKIAKIPTQRLLIITDLPRN